MSLIVFSGSGDFSRTERFLAKLQHGNMYRSVSALAQQGVDALSAATPVESGITAASWSSEVQFTLGGCTIWWRNNHVDSEGVPIAIMLQTGHGTGTGGYVQGRDYINPAIRPVMDSIANAVWREVTSDG
jgi:hypothetical protein